VEVADTSALRSEAPVKFWVTLEDHSAEVEFHTEGGRLVLDLEGRRLEADFLRLPDGEVYSLLVDGRSYEVGVAPSGEGVEVTSHGSVMPVEVRHPLEKLLQSQKREGGGTAGETVNAPMPGLLVAYRVKLGDHVKAGQSVAVVEAMKMQNELTARRGGVVSELLAAERASVAAGQPLLRLKPEST
jgi:3-methylcrotonyl-CoA carboxylase alpha subunit